MEPVVPTSGPQGFRRRWADQILHIYGISKSSSSPDNVTAGATCGYKFRKRVGIACQNL
jgi:hypothetical protein